MARGVVISVVNVAFLGKRESSSALTRPDAKTKRKAAVCFFMTPPLLVGQQDEADAIPPLDLPLGLPLIDSRRDRFNLDLQSAARQRLDHQDDRAGLVLPHDPVAGCD